MPYFAYCPSGIVNRVERIESVVMQDDHGVEQEALGQAFLVSCYPDTDSADYVLTHYPVGQPTPYPRGKYAGIGDTWDGSNFISPSAP
jgi:hypothetical protein